MNEKEWNFEQAFSKLEKILEEMNCGNVALDKSLELYEEADRLISLCYNKLTAVEKRVEMLLKKRDLELELDENKQPRTQPFNTQGQE